MTKFDNLKNSYIATIQCAMQMGSPYEQTKQGNDMLHKVCEMIVDSSDYCDTDKRVMKMQLESVKETLSKQIESRYFIVS